MNQEAVYRAEIGGVSVTLLRCDANDPSHKSYRLAATGAEDGLQLAVQQQIISHLKNNGYDVHYWHHNNVAILDGRSGAYRPLSDDGASRPLNASVIAAAMDTLARKYPSAQHLTKSIRPSRTEEHEDRRDRLLLRRAGQEAAALLPVNVVEGILKESLERSLANPAGTEDARQWDDALHAAAKRIHATLIENLAIHGQATGAAR